MQEFIYETSIKEGVGLVPWRVLNLNTGQLYSAYYATEQQALNSIKHGDIRNGKTVRAMPWSNVFWQAFIRQ